MYRMLLASFLLVSLPALAQDETGVDSASDVEPLTLATEAPVSTRMGCRRAVGLMGGLTTTRSTWQFIDDGPVSPLGSPTVSMSCTLERPGAFPDGALFGIESAPFYVSRGFGDDQGSRLWLQATFGQMFHLSDAVDLGPVMSFSWGRIGGGARVVSANWAKRRGLDGRLIAFYNGGFELQAAISMVLDYRRGEGRR